MFAIASIEDIKGLQFTINVFNNAGRRHLELDSPHMCSL